MSSTETIRHLLGLDFQAQSAQSIALLETPLPGKWVIFSGAGLSKESGLATFRSKDGLWANHSIEEICHVATWRANRKKVKEFYEQRCLNIQAAQPHAGHRWCVGMERRGAILITQNIDTLLERAGAQKVLHVHGRVDHWQCFDCQHIWEREDQAPSHCPSCQSADIRVDVVFFGERARGYRAMEHHLASLTGQDTLVIIGTAGQVVNPISLLQDTPRIIVVDPDPAKTLTQYPHTEILRIPASQVSIHLPFA